MTGEARTVGDKACKHGYTHCEEFTCRWERAVRTYESLTKDVGWRGTEMRYIFLDDPVSEVSEDVACEHGYTHECEACEAEWCDGCEECEPQGWAHKVGEPVSAPDPVKLVECYTRRMERAYWLPV